MPSLLSYVQHRRFPQGRCSWMRAVFLGTILFNVRLGNLKLMISTELHKYFGRNTWIEVWVFRGSEFRDTQGSGLSLRDTLTVYGVTYYAMGLSFSGVWVFKTPRGLSFRDTQGSEFSRHPGVWVFETPRGLSFQDTQGSEFSRHPGVWVFKTPRGLSFRGLSFWDTHRSCVKKWRHSES